MGKFKVGDRVRVEGYDYPHAQHWDGKEAVITDTWTRNGATYFAGDFADRGEAAFKEQYLVLVSEFAVKGLDSLPPGTLFIGANRYDTDIDSRLHLWTADGQSFDIIWQKS